MTRNMRRLVFLFLLAFLCLPLSACNEQGLVEVNPSRSANLGDTGYQGRRNELTGSNIIAPGQSIGPLRIGDNFDTAVSTLGKPYFDQSYTFTNCSERLIQWQIMQSNDRLANMKSVLNTEGSVIQIQLEGDGFATAEGIENGISLKEFKKKYAEIASLELFAYTGLKSNNKFVEGYSAYFVNIQKGIAFELFKNREKKAWLVGSIFVFSPGQDFAPWRYCDIGDKSHWIQFYSLDLDAVRELR